MSARDQVLAHVRASLADVPAHEEAAEAPIPRAEPLADSVAIELFVQRVEEYRGAVRRVESSAIASVVGELFSGKSGRLLLAPGVDRAWVPGDFDSVTDESFSPIELDGFAGVLTGCYLAIAETGTIVLDGGGLSGRRAISLVPDLHICVVRSDQIVGSVPDAIDRLQDRRGAPLTFISGPSATSDIEFNRVEGVHGPRRLEVVLTS